jgi:tetratricopeptide (TPR) repeat protein
MKKWLITAAVVITLVGLAITSPRWLAPSLAFLGANSTVIQTLSSLVQLALWLCSGVALVVGVWRIKKPEAGRGSESRTQVHATATGDNSAAFGGGMSGGNLVTGGDNIVGGQLEVGGDIVRGDKTVTYIHEAPPPTANALHQLPDPPRDFTGRKEELDELTREIGSGGATISGLRGQGGIGKTALALKLAEGLTRRFPDAQFYLDLKGTTQPLSPADVMAHVIRAYHPAAKLPEGLAELSALYLSVLHGQRALLLMDNARDAEQVEPLIPPDPCILLVTSRWHFHVPGLVSKDLDKLPDEDAHKLLLRIAPRVGEHDGEIARLCGYLPLALRLAASALAERRDLSPADYARRLADEQQRLTLLGKVEVSLNLSYELLTPTLQKLWRSLAVFPATFDAPSAAAVWELEQDAAQDALGELVKYSLLDWDDTTARYSLHDLARLLADKCLRSDERINSQKRHAEYYLNLLRQAAGLYDQGSDTLLRGLSLFDSEWANVQVGQAWSRDHGNDYNGIDQICSSYPIDGVNLLLLRQPPLERISWLEDSLFAAQRLNNRADEATRLGNIGNVYYELNEFYRAIEYYQKGLAIEQEINDPFNTCIWLGNLGLAHYRIGKFEQSLSFYKQSLSAAQELVETEPVYILKVSRQVSATLTNLGIYYREIGGSQKAIECQKQALHISREIGDLRIESNVLWSMAETYLKLHKPLKARIHMYKALRIFERLGDRKYKEMHEYLVKSNSTLVRIFYRLSHIGRSGV